MSVKLLSLAAAAALFATTSANTAPLTVVDYAPEAEFVDGLCVTNSRICSTARSAGRSRDGLDFVFNDFENTFAMFLIDPEFLEVTRVLAALRSDTNVTSSANSLSMPLPFGGLLLLTGVVGIAALRHQTK